MCNENSNILYRTYRASALASGDVELSTWLTDLETVRKSCDSSLDSAGCTLTWGAAPRIGQRTTLNPKRQEVVRDRPRNRATDTAPTVQATHPQARDMHQAMNGSAAPRRITMCCGSRPRAQGLSPFDGFSPWRTHRLIHAPAGASGGSNHANAHKVDARELALCTDALTKGQAADQTMLMHTRSTLESSPYAQMHSPRFMARAAHSCLGPNSIIIQRMASPPTHPNSGPSRESRPPPTVHPTPPSPSSSL
nr:hypothetical protein CFP56_09086 [Quercus suber]